MMGTVYLVGAGPGDPELLTVKALRILREADVLLHDELVSAEILQLAPSTAETYNVGKRCGRKSISQDEINSLMIHRTRAGLTVVRLKGGDPLIFGRAGEEIEALRNAQVPFEIIPGITAALGAAAAAQIPLTHRRLASRIVFFTGHRSHGASEDWSSLVASGATLVFYMPGDNYAQMTEKLHSTGLPPSTPCALVSQATTAAQQVHTTTITELAELPPLPAPTILIVGATAEFAFPVFSPQQRERALVNCWPQLQSSF